VVRRQVRGDTEPGTKRVIMSENECEIQCIWWKYS
jgi:hypothetical protein